MAQPSRATRATPAKSTRAAPKRVPQAGDDVPSFSPLDVLKETLERTPAALTNFTEESLLSVKYDATVQKYGVEFARTIWVSSQLQALTSLPGKWRKDQHRLEIRYDAAAASRDMLTSILVLARAPDGRVVARVRCIPKEEALQGLDRELQAATARRYVEGLVGDRADAQVDRVEVYAGSGAARRQRALQHDVEKRRRSQKNARGAPPPTSPAKKATSKSSTRNGSKPRATVESTTTRPKAQRGRRSGSREGAPPTISAATRDAMDMVSAQFLAADKKRQGSP